MGGAGSRRRRTNTAIPPYSTPGGSPAVSRPGAPGTNLPGGSPINRDQQRELMQANQTIQNLNAQINALRGGAPGGMPYGGFPSSYPSPYPGAPGGLPSPYGTPPMYSPPPYSPPSPFLQQAFGQNPMGYQQQAPPAAVYRETDFASLASIAGLNPNDIALLHREFLNLTRGGSGKIDRTIFRQMLRDILMEVNNENVDRAIESIFISVDRNRDGFIDFPEFVGAFKDVLKGDKPEFQSQLVDQNYSEILADQVRAGGIGSGLRSQPIHYTQQVAQAPQMLTGGGGLSVVPLASMGIQQSPLVFGGAAPVQMIDANPPFLSLDPNQSSYVIATPGQYLITQPTAMQCVPLPLV